MNPQCKYAIELILADIFQQGNILPASSVPAILIGLVKDVGQNEFYMWDKIMRWMSDVINRGNVYLLPLYKTVTNVCRDVELTVTPFSHAYVATCSDVMNEWTKPNLIPKPTYRLVLGVYWAYSLCNSD